MANFKKNHNTYNFWHSPIFLGILFCIVILFTYNIVGLVQKERETAKKKELVLDQIEILHTREKALSTDIARLKTDEGIEDTIREKYQVVKPGEKVVMIVDATNTENQTDADLNDRTFWGYIKRLFSK